MSIQMSKPPEDFAVFILTHARPNNVVTYKTLKSCGYSGPIYFIVDNEDKCIEEYRRNYGADRVCVFDKKAAADACDEGNNFDERRTITMARNACFEVAKDIGIKYFIELDDDYTQFRWRFVDKYRTKGYVHDMDNALAKMLEFYKKSNARAIAFAQGGDFIGGEGCGLLSNYNNNSRKCMNSFICSTERPFKFIGAMNEDVNTYTTLGSRGHLFLTIPFIGLEQKATQSQEGGITDMYLRFGTYCKGFTTVMMQPSSVKVSMMGFTSRRLHHKIAWSKTVPRIVRNENKKTK